MAASFNTIGVFGRVNNTGVIETLNTLISFLTEQNKTIFIDEETAASLNDANLPTLPRETIGEKCDLLIVVGGDGSLLHAAHTVVRQQTPVLGINRGRLGFLTDVLPTQLDKIKAILAGEYQVEERFLINAEVTLHGKLLGQALALNEAALMPDSLPHMSEFEIYIDDHFVCSQDSDGLIVATPTGSTAYALSGGGPILHPQLDAMVLVPMYPHSLNLRPIVVDANQTINIIITPNNNRTPRLSCDGQGFISTPPCSHIQLKKSEQALKLVHPLDYDYYETLRSKLHWGHKLQYTE